MITAALTLRTITIVDRVGPIPQVTTSRATSSLDHAIVRPRRYLSAEEDPVLAKIWDNEDDDIFDTL